MPDNIVLNLSKIITRIVRSAWGLPGGALYFAYTTGPDDNLRPGAKPSVESSGLANNQAVNYK